MPLVTVSQWVLVVLNGMPLPANTGTLQAFVTPPNPEEDQLDPHAYIWPSSGSEHRESIPRAGAANAGTNQSGWKTLTHQIDVWLTWFDDNDHDPNPDISFPAVIDAVMAALRTTQDPVLLPDPVTGLNSWVYATGERMTWDFAGVRGTDADQRILRYDARILARILEDIQA